MKLLRIFILLLIFSALANLVKAQNIDSLKAVLTKTKYPEQRSIILKKLAWVNRNVNLKVALDYAHEALELSKKTNNRKLEAEVMRIIGVMYLHFVYHSEGLDWTQRALLISQEIDFDEGVAFCYDSFGVTYYYQKKYAVAQKYFEDALKIFEKINNVEGLGYTYTHLSWIYREQGKYEYAIEVVQKSLEARKKFGDIRLFANTLRDIAQIYDRKGEQETALSYMWQSIAIMEKVPNKPFIDEHYQAIANIWYKNNPDSALYYAQLAYKYAHQRNDRRQKVNIYELYYKIYNDRKDYEHALFYERLHYQYKDSVYSDNIDRNNASLAAKFEYQEREKVLIAQQKQRQAEDNLQIQHQKWVIYTISFGILFLSIFSAILYRNWLEKQRLNKILDTQNIALAKQAAYLEEVNLFKDKLFFIISHDLRAPLGQVQSVLEILENGLLETEEFLKILPKLLQNVVITMDFLDNLLFWAKTQIQGQYVDRQYFDVCELVEKNIVLFEPSAANKEIALTCQQEQVQTAFADKNMTNLIIRNLINNAIKFCNKNDEIKIFITENNNFLQILIADTGVGIAKENAGKLLSNKHFSSKGTNGEKGTGLGLKLCRDFVQKNGGELWFESEVGKGSKFYFTLPMQQGQI